MIHRYIKTPRGETHHERNCEQYSVTSCDFCGDVIPDTIDCVVLEIHIAGWHETHKELHVHGRKVAHRSTDHFHMCLSCASARLDASENASSKENTK